ncbi:hypothetical protein BH10PSE12_BH10PSE12_14880 [soil metagenome]
MPFTMPMFGKALIGGVVASLFAVSLIPQADALGRRDEQDAARRAMLDGQVMPFSILKRRVEAEMGDATYLGSEFNPSTNRYRLKYVKEGKVVWVDVDGRTGDITGWAR